MIIDRIIVLATVVMIRIITAAITRQYSSNNSNRPNAIKTTVVDLTTIRKTNKQSSNNNKPDPQQKYCQS